MDLFFFFSYWNNVRFLSEEKKKTDLLLFFFPPPPTLVAVELAGFRFCFFVEYMLVCKCFIVMNRKVLAM